jgi:sRNA-binding carbon storage regulator CsrA
MLTHETLEVGEAIYIGDAQIRITSIQGTQVEVEIRVPSHMTVRFTTDAAEFSEPSPAQ